MKPVPLGTEKLAEWVAHGKAHADPIGAELLNRGGAEILRLADSHGAESLRGRGGWSQGLEGTVVARGPLERPPEEQVKRVLPLIIEPRGHVDRAKKSVHPKKHGGVVPHASE
jgi:hypothetical protein